MEYQNTGDIDANHDGDAACAVCAIPNDGHIYTEWGRYGGCSTAGHTQVYTGVIMGNHYSQATGESVCVDLERAMHPGSSNSDDNGGLLYTTEVQQGSAHEGWYPHDVEAGCTVCVAPTPVYSRWGSRSCPSGSSKMYEGFMAGTHYEHGGAANTLCLTQNSNSPPGATTQDNNGNLLYGKCCAVCLAKQLLYC
jgi:hypothetical protein